MNHGEKNTLMNLKQYLRKSSNVVLGCALLIGCGLWSCVLDWDHVFVWLLDISDPVNFSGIQGRPFHTVAWFVCWSVISALVARRLES